MKRTPSIRQMIDEGYVGAADILPDEIAEMIERGEIDLDDVLPRDDDDEDDDDWYRREVVGMGPDEQF